MQLYLKYAWALKKAVPKLTSANLLNHLQYSGWKIIYSDLDGGKKMLKGLGLMERAEHNPAFTAMLGHLRVVVVRQNLTDKQMCNLLVHEVGHIMLGHNIASLSEAEEAEANQFTRQCLVIYKLWDGRWWIGAVGIALLLVAISGIVGATSKECAHCLQCCK